MEEPLDPPPQGGEITKLEVQKNNSDRVSVFIGGEFAFGVHQDLVLKHRLHAGRTLTPDEQQAIVEDDRVAKAKARALDYLAHKPRTETEVRRKLRENAYTEPVIASVVERLHELRYLDDARYAEQYVERRFASKGYGPVRIRQELRKRGIDRHLAEAAVDDFFADQRTLPTAREKAEKRWPRIAREDDPRKRRDKLYRYLKRRGYTYDTIRVVIDEMEAQYE
jgi:regulatory protein